MTQVIRTLTDTITSEASPGTNYVRRPTLDVRGGSGRRILTQIKVLGLPSTPDVVVESAVLRLYPTKDFTAADFQVRRLEKAWTPSTVRWADQPDGTLIRSFNAAGKKEQPFDIDLTAQVQAWVTGGVKNNGIRLGTTSEAWTPRTFHSMNATGTKARFQPVLLLTYSAKPERPEGLTLTGGGAVSLARPTLSWAFADTSGASIDAYQIQTNGNDVWTLPAYDSGTLTAVEPVHVWHEDLPFDSPVWYRVRHRSTNGRWSDWSEGYEFVRRAKPTLTVTSPSGAIARYTPSVTWSLSGGTQTQFRVEIEHVASGFIIANSKAQRGAGTVWEPADMLKMPPGAALRAKVTVLDDVERLSTPGDPVGITAVSPEFYVGAGTTAPNISGLRASFDGRFAPALTWTVSAAPDGFVVERRIDEGEWLPIAVPLSAVTIESGVYRWRDITAPGRRRLEYRVRAEVDGSHGAASAVVAIKTRPIYVWLVDPDDPDWSVALAGELAVEMEMGEDSQVVNVIGSDRAVLIHQGFRGYEGSVTGEFYDDLPAVALSAQEMRTRLHRTKTQPTHVWRLVFADLNIPVVVRAVSAVPTPSNEDVYGVSLEFYQQGELDFLEV